MKHPRASNVALWVVQVLLAALFLFAGGVKLTMPAGELASQTGLPALFMQFIGVAEMAGGLGLLLPGLVRIHRELTPVAAVGLTVIMVGAVVVTVLHTSVGAAVLPFVVGALLALVVRGRREWYVSIS